MKYENFEKQLGGWAPKMREFIESEKMDAIYAFLKAQSKEGRIICPDSADTFKAFLAVPPEKLKCIFWLADPYHTINQGVKTANGIPIDCSNNPGGKLQPSLDLFYDAIEEEIYDGLNLSYHKNPSLEYLTRQGVMLLNSSLTVEAHKPSSHKDLWIPFMQYFIEEVINSYFRGLPIVLAGRNSQELEEYINPLSHRIFKISHPASAAHKQTKWSAGGVFKAVNKIIQDNNGEFILWLDIEAPF